MAKKDQPQQGVAEQLQPLVDDDAFLTTLSEGTDPSDGSDELAGLLLELRGDVEKQMPPAPLIEGAEEEPEVISLGAARRRRSKPFMHGLIGAAAATLLIARYRSCGGQRRTGFPAVWREPVALRRRRARCVCGRARRNTR